MLEEDLPEGFKGAPKLKEKKYVKRQKTILEGTLLCLKNLDFYVFCLYHTGLFCKTTFSFQRKA